MNKELTGKDWKAFANWERNYKKKFLKTLSVDSAFEIFSELWEAHTKFSAKEMEKFRKRRMEELVMVRKSFDIIQKRLHA
ncbi:MAG: hypothetical protein O8C66_11500 [Candidatus Methanoperedens sp.]|nr:hypothetical protein [Candidatus Methanoperedens sp.]MCZ7371126.1 hypothetical protein [Candidatus Methanoperedens sp.]